MLPNPIIRSEPVVAKATSSVPKNKFPFLSRLHAFISAGVGVTVGLFVTVVVIAGECAVSCTSAQALPPAAAFLAATIGCLVALIYGLANGSRTGLLWCQAFGWLSGAVAYLAAYAVRLYA